MDVPVVSETVERAIKFVEEMGRQNIKVSRYGQTSGGTQFSVCYIVWQSTLNYLNLGS